MLDLNLPSINIENSTDGVWFQYNDDISFKIARDGNPKHKRALQAKAKQLEKLRDKGDYKRMEMINNENIARYILKDWSGIKDKDGDITFSQDVALTIISDPQYEQIRNFIIDSSREEFEYEADKDEAAIVKK